MNRHKYDTPVNLRLNESISQISGLYKIEVFTTMTIRNVTIWDLTLCGFCKNRRFGGKYRLHY
jgi:hypothetical protein